MAVTRILIGHLDYELPPYDTERFDVRSVRYGRDGQGPPRTIAEMLEQCPSDWLPDVYYHAGLVHFPIPADIETFAGMTAAHIQDWHRGGRAVWAGAGFFDLIVTERNAQALLKASGYKNAAFARFWGVNPAVHRVLPDVEKDIDILFIGSLNAAVWEERNRWVARIARLSAKYKVVVAVGHYGEHYVRLTNRAKIVFNRSVNGCTNQRAYDGPVCGALVFNEEENHETREIFADRVHCVYYNSDNLETLLDYYLTHEVEREQIAAAGRELILRKHTESVHLNELFALLAANKNLRYRPHAALPPLECATRKVMQIFSSALPAGIYEASAILQEAEEAGGSIAYLLQTQAALHGWAAHHIPALPDKIKSFSTAIELARRALKAAPHNPMVLSTFAFLLLERAELTQGKYPTGKNDIVEAAVALSSTAEICEQFLFAEAHTEDTNTVVSPFPEGWLDFPNYPRWNDQFDCRLERAYLQRDLDYPAWEREMAATLAWRCRVMLSDLAAANAQREEALRQAQAAWQDSPLEADALLRLARCEAMNGLLTEAAEHYRDGLTLTPLAYTVWPEQAAVLNALGASEELAAFLLDCDRLLDAIPGFEAVRPALKAATAD